MKLKKYINLNLIVAAAFTVFAFMMLAVRNGYILRWYDEMSLFEPTGFFFKQFLRFPGGILRYAGTWLTQFMYYPWLGTAILVALWLLMAWLIRRAFGLARDAAPLSYVIPIALFASVAQLDEAWVSMKSPGYLFFPTLGYIFTVGGVWIYRKIRMAFPRVIFMALLACCYPFAGFFALLSALICAVMETDAAIRDRNWIAIAGTAAVIAIGIFVPQAYYLYFEGNTADNDYLYLKGLPDFYMETYDTYLWIPFIVATTALLLLTLISSFRLRTDGRIWSAIGLAAVAGCGIWGVAAERKSEHLRATVLMMRAMDRGDWQRVIDIMSIIREYPNYTMRLLSSLATTRLGGDAADLSAYKPLNIDARHSESFTMTAFVNVPVNYYIGELNQSYRWAMEHSVQYGKRVFYLKFMVKTSLLNGETELARRYNDILLRTMFHRRWAQEMQRYIDDPSLIDSNPEFGDVLSANRTALRKSLRE